MPGSGETNLLQVHRRVLDRLGPLGWWPGESPFEIVVGAILTQNTAWTRVEEAIAALRAADLLDAKRLAAVPRDELERLIRPAGTFRIKAGYLTNVLTWLTGRYDGDVGRALDGDTGEKRAELLALKGVGRETADSLLCYAGGHAIFVVDTYTRRILGRHGPLTGDEPYDVIREWFEARLPRDAAVLNEVHGQIVSIGKDWCRPRRPRCEACPLAFLFERSGREGKG